MAVNFREATDALLAGVGKEELAKAMGKSVALIDQARLRDGAKARRNPPPDWEKIAARLAEQHAARLTRLATRLRGQS